MHLKKNIAWLEAIGLRDRRFQVSWSSGKNCGLNNRFKKCSKLHIPFLFIARLMKIIRWFIKSSAVYSCQKMPCLHSLRSWAIIFIGALINCLCLNNPLITTNITVVMPSSVCHGCQSPDLRKLKVQKRARPNNAFQSIISHLSSK